MNEETQKNVESVAVEGASTLPPAFGMVKAALNYVVSRYDLALWYIGVSVLSLLPVVLGGLIFGFSTTFGGIATALGIMVMIVMVIITVTLAIMNAGAILFSATSLEAPSYKEGFSWARTNIWPLLWLQLLTTLVVMGGFLLLIVPGVIVGVYLSLAQVVLAREGLRGMDAFNRSWQLVKNNWWGVLGRVAAIVVVVIAVSMVAEIISLGSEALSAILSFIITGFTTVAMLHVVGSLYHSLSAQKPPYQSDSTMLYKVLGVICLLAIVIPTFGAVLFAG